MYIIDKCSSRKIAGSEFCTPQRGEHLAFPSRTDCLREYPASGLFFSENRGGWRIKMAKTSWLRN